MSLTQFGACFACLAGLCGTARAETLYRWIDADGATRITRDQPGTAIPYSAFDVPDTVPWSNAPAMPGEIAVGSSPTAQNLFKAASQSVYGVVGRLPSRSDGKAGAVYGSAIAVTDKLAITNCHVIEAAGDEIYIGTGSAEAGEKARLVAANYLADRCVIGVRNMDLQPVAGVRSFDALEVGETVYAIGNPSRLDRTLSDGLLSAKRVMGELRYLQTSAPISPGSSGGGLFDGRGNLIGVTAFTLKGAQNINFAIPAEDFWK
ncbi:MAG TPA: serine protease [Burkholderiaceae bacterium]|nr:serine protease [Burkholderiaceae bacterium]